MDTKQRKILAVALRARHLARMAEMERDLCAAMAAFKNDPNTSQVDDLFSDPERRDYSNYYDLKAQLDNSKFINTVGNAGMYGSYWRLTEAGKVKALECFEFAMLSGGAK
jgi:hypothetical protein